MQKFHEDVTCILSELKEHLFSVDLHKLSDLTDCMLRCKSIFFAGAGRSRLVMGAAAMRAMQIGLQAHLVGEVTTPAIGAEDLLIVLSGSGETPTMLLNAEQAKKHKASVAVITANADSNLAKIADIVIMCGSADERSVQIGAATFEQSALILNDMISAYAADRLKLHDVNSCMHHNHANME